MALQAALRRLGGEDQQTGDNMAPRSSDYVLTMILSFAPSILILFGCVVPDAPPAEYPGTDVCYQTEAYMAYCETDFYFAPGYWVPAKYGHVWVRGHYLPRPGHRGFHGRGGVHEVHGPRGHR